MFFMRFLSRLRPRYAENMDCDPGAYRRQQQSTPELPHEEHGQEEHTPQKGQAQGDGALFQPRAFAVVAQMLREKPVPEQPCAQPGIDGKAGGGG